MKKHTSIHRPAMLALTLATLGTCAVLAQEPEELPAIVDVAIPDPFRKDAAGADALPNQIPSAEMLDAQARVLFARGETEQAIHIQELAIAKAQETLARATENLARYQGRPMDTGYVAEKLDRILLPEINFENMTLEEALNFIRSKAKDLDTEEPRPEMKGVSIVVDAGGKIYPDPFAPGLPPNVNWPQSRVIEKLQLNSMPIGAALKYICLATESRFEIDEHAVIIYGTTEAE